VARLFECYRNFFTMNKLVRALIAGWGAKKIGGGCISTIIVFIIIYYALGTCNSHPVQTVPQKHSDIHAPAKHHLSNNFVLESKSVAVLRIKHNIACL
jgi:hypothetical protein